MVSHSQLHPISAPSPVEDASDTSCPLELNPKRWAEWIDGSGVDPDLANSAPLTPAERRNRAIAALKEETPWDAPTQAHLPSQRTTAKRKPADKDGAAASALVSSTPSGEKQTRTRVRHVPRLAHLMSQTGRTGWIEGELDRNASSVLVQWDDGPPQFVPGTDLEKALDLDSLPEIEIRLPEVKEVSHSTPAPRTRPTQGAAAVISLPAAIGSEPLPDWVEAERVGSAIPADIWANSTEVLPDQEYGYGELIGSPLDEALRTNSHPRFGQQARLYTEGIVFYDHEGRVAGAKTDRPWKTAKQNEPGYKSPRYRFSSTPGAKAYRPPYLPQDIEALAQFHGLKAPEPEDFWAWVAAHPSIPIVLVEGQKKALSALRPSATAGVAVIGVGGHCSVVVRAALRGEDGKPVPGEFGGWAKSDDERELAIGLGSLFPCGTQREMILALDEDEKKDTRKRVAASRNRIGWHWLLTLKAKMSSCQWQNKLGKGPDDVIARHGSECWLKILANRKEWKPGLKRRLTRPYDKVINGRPLQPSDIPADEKLVLLHAPMGSQKTLSIAGYLELLQAEGQTVISLVHRRSLAAALGNHFGVPDGSECRDKGQRTLGMSICVDSAHPESGAHFRVSEYFKPIVIIDECVQVLDHLLTASTQIRKVRPQVMREIEATLKGAKQVLCADALMTDEAIRALEALTGQKAYVIRCNQKPAQGRKLHLLDSPGKVIAKAIETAERGERVFIYTTAQREASAHAAQAIAMVLKGKLPDKEILVVDSETAAVKGSDAANLATDPVGIAQQYDVIITTPVVETGVSIHESVVFGGVFGITSGINPVENVVQAMARVRHGCPRYLCAPEIGNAQSLRMGNGDKDPDAVLTGYKDASDLAIAAIAKAGLPLNCGGPGDWMKIYAAMAAQRNRDLYRYGETILSLLEAEGYELQGNAPIDAEEAEAAAKASDAAVQIRAQLKEAKAQRKKCRHREVSEAKLISRADASALRKKAERESLTPQEKRELEHHRINERYGEEVTPELVEADDNGLYGQLQMLFFLTLGKPHLAKRDRQKVEPLAVSGSIFAPDLLATQLGTKVAKLQELGIERWLTEDREFKADDNDLLDLADECIYQRAELTQHLGLSFSENARPTTILRKLLKLLGYKLKPRQTRDRAAGWSGLLYHVERQRMPVDPVEVMDRWLKDCEG